MKKTIQLFILILISTAAMAQTSWKGTSSTSWSNSANWTNGVPNSTKAAILGDANFTGSFQPKIGNSASCAGLTLSGTKATTLTLSKNLTVSGNVLINANGSISQGKVTITVSGNWTNNGTYGTTSTSANVAFTGTAATLTGATSFKKLTINANAVVSVASNIDAAGIFSVSGTLNPAAGVAITGAPQVKSTGTLKVNATTFAANYPGTPTLSAGSTVDYCASGDQTVASGLTYSILKISGSGIKSLANTITLSSASSLYGSIFVTAGTLDLLNYTANRNAASGGTLSVSNGATLRIGGGNSFPLNYTTNTLSLTSTVEYYGNVQTIGAQTYGNLLLTGASAKNFPASAVTIAGNLTTSGTLTATAGAALTISGAMNIGAGTTFDGAAVNTSVAGGISNAGTITSTSGTLTINGPGTSIGGNGTFNLNNLAVTASGTTSSVGTLTVNGNLSTTGSGVFTHTGGTLSMTGTGKTITGSNITLNNLTVVSGAGNGTITANSGFTLTGNLAVTNSGNSFTSTGVLVMSGASKTISGSGTISFNTLSATGSITTGSSFFISNTLDVTGSLTASGGTATFTGTSLFNGTANLYDVTVSGTSLQLAANSNFGIAGNFAITSGTFNATTTKPNYVVYNSTGTQNVTGATYDNLSFSNGSTKSAVGAVTVTTDLTINSGTTFSAGSYTHTVQGNWINNGNFTPGSSTVQFTGANDATLSGATTFNAMTIDKTNATNSVFLSNNMTTPALSMTKGVLRTGSNKISVSNTLSFPGTAYIVGTIERTLVGGFADNVNYNFESANNIINFASPSGITNVTVTVTQANVASFPFGAAINRSYTISNNGSYSSATLQLHYEDNELNGNTEGSMTLWNYNGSTWTNQSSNSSNTTTNWVSKSGITNIAQTWTLSATSNVVRWNGSVSSDWATPGNWTSVQGSPSMPPTANDIVEIGTGVFTNQPTISSTANAKSIRFGSVQSATLTLAPGGSLTTQGNISGSWSANATHSISVGAQTLTVNGDIILSDGTSGHDINLSLGAGNVSLSGSLTQKGAAAISFTGAGNLSIGGDFLYTAGNFTAGTGTVTYNGGNFQAVGSVTYNQLVINKSAATATTSGTSTVNGDLSVLAGTFDFSGATTILGNFNVSVGASATNRSSVTIAGNWNNNGNYIPNGGVATFNGTGNQTIKATYFNKIIVNKPSGTATLLGNITLNSDLIVNSGTLDLGTFTANRNTIGGTMQVDNGATLYVGGASNFPLNYTYYTFGNSSNTIYNGTVAQSVYGASYGNLTFSNGGSNAKTLAGSTTANGNLVISSGATLNGSSQNLTLFGNWTNNGTFTPATSTVLPSGTSKTITGNTTFYRMTVYGSYTVAGSDINYNNSLTIVTGGSYDAGSGTAVVTGNLTNNGSLTSSGTTTFAGTQAQTIRLVNAITSTSTGIINFNGSVAPTLNSTSTPVFATLNINNTDPAGISPSVNWTILGNFTINAGATFNGGTSTHTMTGNVTNNGTVTSTGTLLFSPSTAKTVALGSGTFSSSGTVNFGGTGALTVSGTPGALSNVVIGNTTGVSPSGNWSNISGTFTISSGAVLNAGSYTYTLTGDMESNGTLNGGTSNFVFAGTAQNISGSPATTFYDVTVNNTSTLAINSEFNVDHNIAINGLVDANLSGFAMTGSGAGAITSTGTSIALIEFEVAKTNATATLSKNLTGSQALTISSGTFDIGTNTITQDGTNTPNNQLVMLDGSRLRIDGSNALPTYSVYSLDSLSTVEYYGTLSQALTPGISYGSIEVKAGTKTTTAGLTIQKNVIISGGTFTAGNFTHNVGGDWTQTGGTFTPGTGTIHFNGAGPQTVKTLDAFNNVTLNNASNVSLGGNMRVAGTLDFTVGRLVLGSFNLSANTISNATSAKYIVAEGSGSLRKAFSATAPIVNSQTYPVGLSTAYTPVTVAFGTNTTDSVNVRMKASAWNNGETGTALSNYAVNATWIVDRQNPGTGTPNASITVQWPASLELPNFSRSSCRLAHYTSGAWEYGASGLSATGSNPYTVTRSGFNSFSPFSVRMNNAALPVTLVRFSGNRRTGNDELVWMTASESNSDRFEIEQSTDGRSFSAIGSLAAAGFSNGDRNYQYTVRNAAGSRFYRLRLVDRDGRYTYSNVVRLSDASSEAALVLNANPVKGDAQLQVRAAAATSLQLSLVDGSGRIVWSAVRNLGAGNQTIVLPTGALASGIYYLNAYFADGRVETVKLVK